MPIIFTKNFKEEVPTDFLNEIARRTVAKKAYDYVYIVPTRRRVREIQRELNREYIFGTLPVYTLELFAAALFSQVNFAKKIISPPIQAMIVDKILCDIKPRYFIKEGTSGHVPPGTLKKIVDQISYLKENGITPEDYNTLIGAADETEWAKLKDFQRIYAEYQNRLGEKLVDAAGIIATVNKFIRNRSPELDRWLNSPLVFFIEGFYSFKKPELELIKNISLNAEACFAVKLDCTSENEELFRTMYQTAEELKSIGFKEQNQNREDEPSSTQISILLGKRLFKKPIGEVNKINLRENFLRVCVPDIYSELEYVAKRIKDIVAQNPSQQLSRICVASHLPQNYSQIFREVFTAYGIPANITDRYTLDNSALINSILSFIELKIRDFERDSLFRATSSDYIIFSEQHEPRKARNILYRTAALCKFERGFSYFLKTIESKIAVLSKIQEDSDADRKGSIQRDIETLQSGTKLLKEINDRLQILKDNVTAAELRNEIMQLVKELHIYENITCIKTTNVPTEIIERDARALSKFFSVLDEIVDLGFDDRSMGLSTWLDNLKAALPATRYNIRQRHGYGVYVTALDEIRGLNFDYLFVVGLTEGEFPSKYEPEIFLPVQKQFDNKEIKPYMQRYLFYQAITSSKKVVLIYPARKDQVKLPRSSFLDALESIAEFPHVDYRPETGSINLYNAQQVISLYPSVKDDDTICEKINPYLPQNIRRCLLAESARIRNDKESIFNGRITSRDLVNSLNIQLSERVYSAAQIETLAQCGFRFFAERVLQVEPQPDIDSLFTPLEKGSALHKTLYKFYNEMKQRSKLTNIANENQLLKAYGAQVLDEFAINHKLFDVERDTIIGTDYANGTLDLFLQNVQKNLSEVGFTPEMFELTFGMPVITEDLGHPEPVQIGKVKLRGRIDRIDRHAEKGFVIFDYKLSSSIPNYKAVVLRKTSPQLLLYLLVLHTLLKDKENAGDLYGIAYITLNRNALLNGKNSIKFIVRNEAGGLNYSSSITASRQKDSNQPLPKTMDELLEQATDFVLNTIQKAIEGRFNLTEFEYQEVCVYCPYKEACRVVVVNTSGKSLENERHDLN
ncbi:MAG: PD-(D/E)XK nuclease family protein [Candidatus Kryptoniota bacterium]